MLVHDCGSHDAAMLYHVPVVGHDLAALLNHSELTFVARELNSQRARLDVSREHKWFVGGRNGQRHVGVVQRLINCRYWAHRCAPLLATILSDRLRSRGLPAKNSNLLKLRQFRVKRQDLSAGLNTRTDDASLASLFRGEVAKAEGGHRARPHRVHEGAVHQGNRKASLWRVQNNQSTSAWQATLAVRWKAPNPFHSHRAWWYAYGSTESVEAPLLFTSSRFFISQDHFVWLTNQPFREQCLGLPYDIYRLRHIEDASGDHSVLIEVQEVVRY